MKTQITMEEALSKEQCPLCRMVREAEERLIWFILYESTGDREFRARWDREKGFCRDHNNLIKLTISQGRLVSGSSIARIYETILDGYLHDLQEFGSNSQRKKFPADRKCFFCHKKEELENANITLFIDFLNGEENRKRFDSSSGLCNPHLVRILNAPVEKDNNLLKHFLVEDHLSRLEKLKDNIAELQRKERHDVKQTPTEEELSSWKEALWRFGGVTYDHSLIWSR